MASISTISKNEKSKLSKTLSSLFCSTSIVLFSFLCLLNNLSLDLYSVCVLLKIVVPASFCFWFLGYTAGSILDKSQNSTRASSYKLSDDNEAYSIPSLFSEDSVAEADNTEDL